MRGTDVSYCFGVAQRVTASDRLNAGFQLSSKFFDCNGSQYHLDYTFHRWLRWISVFQQAKRIGILIRFPIRFAATLEIVFIKAVLADFVFIWITSTGNLTLFQTSSGKCLSSRRKNWEPFQNNKVKHRIFWQLLSFYMVSVCKLRHTNDEYGIGFWVV